MFKIVHFNISFLETLDQTTNLVRDVTRASHPCHFNLEMSTAVHKYGQHRPISILLTNLEKSSGER